MLIVWYIVGKKRTFFFMPYQFCLVVFNLEWEKRERKPESTCTYSDSGQY